MHHRDAGKFKENITARRLGLGLIRFIMVMYHLGNRLLQKNSCFLPVYWLTSRVLLPRKGASADFLICRISLRKPYKCFRKIFYLLTNPSSRLCFSSPLFLHLLVQCSKYSVTEWPDYYLEQEAVAWKRKCMGESSPALIMYLVLLESHILNASLTHLKRKFLNFRKDNYSQTR